MISDVMLFVDGNLILNYLDILAEVPGNNGIEVSFMIFHLNLQDIWGTSLNHLDDLDHLSEGNINLF